MKSETTEEVCFREPKKTFKKKWKTLGSLDNNAKRQAKNCLEPKKATCSRLNFLLSLFHFLCSLCSLCFLCSLFICVIQQTSRQSNSHGQQFCRDWKLNQLPFISTFLIISFSIMLKACIKRFPPFVMSKNLTKSKVQTIATFGWLQPCRIHSMQLLEAKSVRKNVQLPELAKLVVLQCLRR